MDVVLGGEEGEGEDEEEAEEDRHHDIKNFFTAEAVCESGEQVGEEEGTWEDGPDFDEGDCFGS